MSTSLIIISVIILLIMFGAGQKILDNLRLNDKQALIILVLICIGLAIPPIWIGKYFCFSIGGYLIPLCLSIYLLISCGFSRDLVRAIIGSLLVGAIIYGLEWLLPADPEKVFIDNMYIYGIVAGIVAYALGRSRRNAFISCLFGITIAELVQWIVNFAVGTPSILGLGVGGAFGAYVVAIIISVALSEFLGRCFESANPDEEEKEYNFKTHTYDSEKNGKLNSKNTQRLRLEDVASDRIFQKSQKEKIKDRQNSKEISEETNLDNNMEFNFEDDKITDIEENQAENSLELLEEKAEQNRLKDTPKMTYGKYKNKDKKSSANKTKTNKSNTRKNANYLQNDENSVQKLQNNENFNNGVAEWKNFILIFLNLVLSCLFYA